MNNDDNSYVNSPFERVDYDTGERISDGSPVQPQSYPSAEAESSVQEVQTVNPTFLPGQSIPGAIPPQSYPPMPQPYYSPYVPGGVTPLLPCFLRTL